MTVALVITVKNEERILRNNLLYHKAIGICHAFVYFDGTTDDGKATIADLDFVTSQDSVSPKKYENFSFLQKFTSQAKEHHTARQCLNTFDALQKSRDAAYDWLISIDADELVTTTLDVKTDLQIFFKGISSKIDVVYLQTKEVLARKSHYTNVFEEETWFKTQPSFNNRFENCRKRIYNPFTKEYQTYSFWLGQHMGKGAIRVGRGIYPHNVHRYKKAKASSVVSEKSGYVLHYHIFDAEDFIKKFKNFSNRPDTFLSGNKVNSLKLLLREVVNRSGLDQEELKNYFEKNLMFSDIDFKKLTRNKYLGFFKRSVSAIQQINAVQKVFQEKIDAH